MAKLHEEILVIKLSTLVRDGVDSNPKLLTNEVTQSLEEVVEQLVGQNCLVEVQVA